MGVFDNLMGNLGGLEAIAQKVGLEPEQMQGLLNEIGAKIGSGETSVSALAETAAEHGVSADALQQLLGQWRYWASSAASWTAMATAIRSTS